MAADVRTARDGALHLPLERGPLRHKRVCCLLVQRVGRVRVLPAAHAQVSTRVRIRSQQHEHILQLTQVHGSTHACR